MPYICAYGRRKNAVAKCKVYPDEKAELKVNGKGLVEYFTELYGKRISDALKEMNLGDIKIEFFVKGGGVMGQAEACRLALTKVAIEHNPELRPVMRSFGWLTRDPRSVLSKQAGLKKARKAPTYVKR